MTNKQNAKLIEMQRLNPVSTEKTLDLLWSIGDIAGIGHICCYQEMLRCIMLSPDIDTRNKNRALEIFERWAYRNGRRDERRDTGGVLNSSWYE